MEFDLSLYKIIFLREEILENKEVCFLLHVYLGGLSRNVLQIFFL